MYIQSVSLDIPELREEEAVLMESLQDEAANSKIKLSLLVGLSHSVLGVKDIVQSIEVRQYHTMQT